MLEKFERYPLTFDGPTPIEKLERLSAELGGKVEIYAKREDCNSGLALGGNLPGNPFCGGQSRCAWHRPPELFTAKTRHG